jgi:predicted acylesterase/phospholipase RssA
MSRIALCLLLALIAGATSAAAQPNPDIPEANQRVVLFSASGGISKGAYQGGVDWTISEFLRRQRTDAFRARLKLDKRAYELGSATGASAGNINAVFAALAWCTESFDHLDPRRTTAQDKELAAERNQRLRGVKGIDAEASLFWKAWVDTGISELLPEKHIEKAAFDRQFFEDVHRKSLDTFRTGAVVRPQCSVPVGLTLTRVFPIEVALDENTGAGTASVQRFASVFQVVSKGTGLDFAPPLKDQGNSRSLGALALLPPLHSNGHDWTPRANAVFKVIKASSSFPVAFAPIDVEYLPGGLTPKEKSTSAVRAQFADGGVFDNNPIGLAAGLFELGKDKESQARRIVAYSSPGNFRGSLAASRIANRPTYSQTGLGAAATLLSGAFSAGREYELQLFARQMARDGLPPKAKVIPELRQSSRAIPIIGETLGSFGAFLGHPFRERDFYLGVYDGLEFIARHVLCEDEKDEMKLKVCVATAHIRLVTDDVFEMSPLARQALWWFLGEEHGGFTAPIFVGTTIQSAQNTLIESTNRHLKNLTVRPDDCAGGGDPIVRALCPNALDEFLTRMHDDSAVRATAEYLRPLCTGTPKSHGQCVVDDAFAELLEHPRREVFRIAKDAIYNIELAEDEAYKGGLSPYVEIASSVFLAATYGYRSGLGKSPFEFFMSSAPRWDGHGWGARIASSVGYIAPSYLHWTHINDQDDSLAFGWRPLTVIPCKARFWLCDKVFLSSQLELSLRDYRFSETFKTLEPWGWGVSVGTFAKKSFAAVEIGALRLPSPTADKLMPRSRWKGEHANPWIGRAAFRFAADKVQVTVLARKHVLTVGLGLNDVNGLIFWWLR